MVQVLAATFKDGVFKPDEQPALSESTRVRLVVETIDGEEAAKRRDLDHMAATIEGSRSLMGEVDEDGQALCSPDTWHRATRFLSHCARRAWEVYGVKIDPPRILPGPDGSIDLHWIQPRYELLINIPSDPTSPLSYYGDDRGTNLVKGTITSDDVRGLLVWLIAMKQ